MFAACITGICLTSLVVNQNGPNKMLSSRLCKRHQPATSCQVNSQVCNFAVCVIFVVTMQSSIVIIVRIIMYSFV